MRFTCDGPDIPGDLLYGTDDGEVVFFCGAGVSRAEAGGPSFKELAQRVVEDLGSARESQARQLLELSDQIAPPLGVGGLPPADRIFALLEQEFRLEDVRSAVARAVRPKANAGLGPHRSLLALSRAPNGIVRLLTTNFDRVFQAAEPGINEILPPDLPDPRRSDAWHGILHLHGMVTPDYSGMTGTECVLSSADFGRAYLADGWATAFMRALIERFRIVFVGYSADDPPIQYLLEALSRSAAPGRLFAFHQGGAEQAAGIWRHKGVTAIPFKDFSALWETLSLWAARARDPEAWRSNVVSQAIAGPRGLKSHVRGQVAHLVSSEVGASLFARGATPPPAEWLCVFDPTVRYDRARSAKLFGPGGAALRPFDSYRLDSDADPGPTRGRSEASTVLKAWSAFESVAGDDTAATTSLRGQSAERPAPLSRRQESLAWWLTRVSGQPVAVWWAAGQTALHPTVRTYVGRQLDASVNAKVRTAWRLLLSSSPKRAISDLDIYQLQRTIAAEGWSPWALRELERLERPYVTVDRPMTAAPVEDVEHLGQLIQKDVCYPAHVPDVIVTSEFLVEYVRFLRWHLQVAHALETEGTGFFYANFRPIVPYDDPGSHFAAADDLSGKVLHMARETERLAEVDPAAARSEVAAWPDVEDPVFRNLRVWTAGVAALTTACEAGKLFRTMSDAAFWDRYAQRDLLVAMSRRWASLDAGDRAFVEQRLLAGSSLSDEVEQPDRAASYRAHRILSRLFWLEREGLAFEFDLDRERQRLLDDATGWSTDDAISEVDWSMQRGGFVRTDTNEETVRNVPVRELLAACEKASGRGRDILLESRPFKGVVRSRPNKALAALVDSAKTGALQKFAWGDFLDPSVREGDRPRLRILIAGRLVRLPAEVFQASLRPITNWFAKCGAPLRTQTGPWFASLWERIVDAIREHPDEAVLALSGDDRREWLTEAINAPAGHIAEMLFAEAAKLDFAGGLALSAGWKVRAAALFAFNGDPLVHVMAIFGSRLNWLYHVDPVWTDEAILSALERQPGSDASRAALRSLLLHGGPWTPLLFGRLKALLVAKAAAQGDGEDEQALSLLLLSGWSTKDGGGGPLVSDVEMREILLSVADGARVAVLRHLDLKARGDGDLRVLLRFLEKVWPRQLTVRTEDASAALARLALSAGLGEPGFVRVVAPLLSTVGQWALPSELADINNGRVEQFPLECLTILFAVLAEDPAKWPYRADTVIQRLSALDATKNDERLTKLRARLMRR